MKLEHLTDGGPDCPLLRLFEFSPPEAERLRDAILQLASGSVEQVEVDHLPFVDALGGCRLRFTRNSWDQSVVRTPEATSFICGLTDTTWGNVAGLVEPFASGATGHQWLIDSPGDLSLLLSASGEW